MARKKYTKEFLVEVDNALKCGMSVAQFAAEKGMRATTVYARIERSGYRIQSFGQLVPVDAPTLI